MTRRIFIDTGWTAAPWSDRCELMWIGLADEDGRSWHGISSEVAIDPATNAFVSGAFRLITREEPRLSRAQLAQAVVDFCRNADEFWAWVPTLESFAQWFGLGEQASELFAKCWDVDLQMLQALVRPWPAGWPSRQNDLNWAAVVAGVRIPPQGGESSSPALSRRVESAAVRSHPCRAAAVTHNAPINRTRRRQAASGQLLDHRQRRLALRQRDRWAVSAQDQAERPLRRRQPVRLLGRLGWRLRLHDEFDRAIGALR